MNVWNEETMYLVANVASAAICIVFGLLLTDMRGYMRYIRETPVFPERYIKARRTLGIAYLIIGGLTAFQIVTGASGKSDDELPAFADIVVSSLQMTLFTGALLSLYNSRMVRMKYIWPNIIPIVPFIAVYAAFHGHTDARIMIRIFFLSFYGLQLVGCCPAFVVEREEYLNHLDNQFSDDSYRAKSVVVLFVCSLAVGGGGLFTHRFTELWQLTLFTALRAVFYGALAVYFLQYARRSKIIEEVTDPEKWCGLSEEEMREWRKICISHARSKKEQYTEK